MCPDRGQPGKGRVADQSPTNVAIPARDRGIDLIAYADLGTQVARFSACPIQLKAAIGGSFSVDRKYAKFPNLLIAYVWYLEDRADGHVCHDAP